MCPSRPPSTHRPRERAGAGVARLAVGDRVAAWPGWPGGGLLGLPGSMADGRDRSPTTTNRPRFRPLPEPETPLLLLFSPLLPSTFHGTVDRPSVHGQAALGAAPAHAVERPATRTDQVRNRCCVSVRASLDAGHRRPLPGRPTRQLVNVCLRWRKRVQLPGWISSSRGAGGGLRPFRWFTAPPAQRGRGGLPQGGSPRPAPRLRGALDSEQANSAVAVSRIRYLALSRGSFWRD